VGRGLTSDRSQKATLRCAVGRFVVHGGRGVADPLLIDTSLSQSRGTGTITFPQEALALTLTGAPKRNSALRLPGSVTLAGTIRAPQLIVPREVKSVGNVLKGIARAITGRQGSRATDADCGAIVARTLG
jgi:AsmA family protein